MANKTPKRRALGKCADKEAEEQPTEAPTCSQQSTNARQWAGGEVGVASPERNGLTQQRKKSPNAVPPKKPAWYCEEKWTSN